VNPETVSISSLVVRGAAVFFLVAANAFFVAAEFALVASRRTRIEAMVRKGDGKAKSAQRAIQSLDRYISGTQLGITAASLSLGWIGEPAVANVIDRFFVLLPAPFNVVATHAVAVAIAFAFITFLHIVLGELAPKALALLHPEATSRWVAGPLILFTEATNPFIWILNGSANLLLRIFGIRAPSEAERVHSPEEILMLAQQSQQSGHLDKGDIRLIEGVFEFTEKTARDVMTPRTDIVAMPAALTIGEAVDTVAVTSRRSRYPVFRESLDDIAGFVHTKELLAGLKERRHDPVTTIVRQPLFVPGTSEVEDVLAEMKRNKIHLAIVLDEYGGTAGLVTMEDLVEEIIGDVYDEHDRPDTVARPSEPGTIPGDLDLTDASKKFGLEITDEDYQTLGGWVFGQLGRLPKKGDQVAVKGGVLEVVEMKGRRVGRLRLTPGAKP